MGGVAERPPMFGTCVSRKRLAFEPRKEALGAWQEVKAEASVNEALYGGAINWD